MASGLKKTPICVLHLPHASTEVPEAIRTGLLLSEEELEEELLRITDHYTDELFGLDCSIAKSIRYPVSRLVADPERFVDDAQEPMSRSGMGVIYTLGSLLQPLRPIPSEEYRSALLDGYYRPHHRSLDRAVQETLAQWGSCLLLDCHSFPSAPLPYEPDQDSVRPDICLGTDPVHTPGWLYEAFRLRFEAAGYSLFRDRPYAGALVPLRHHGKRPEVLSVMIEVNRKLYMDESTGGVTSDFRTVCEDLQSICSAVIAESQLRCV
jgi:N-formylglutamate deformylase